MYTILLSLHSVLRWFVLLSIMYALYRAYRGYSMNKPFTSLENAIRHWTATIAHVQLVVGFTLYIKSPLIKYFWASDKKETLSTDLSFFGWMHILLMLIAIVMVTIGSAKARRATADHEKFKTILIWVGLALIIILTAIPWPFSPLAHRPYFRPF